ncbi:MAG: hypothetical protein AAGH92_12640, partial [Planctomycetota bacterium]
SKLLPNLPWPANSAWFSAFTLLTNPPLVGFELDNRDEAFDLMLELGADRHEPQSFLRCQYQPLLIQPRP